MQRLLTTTIVLTYLLIVFGATVRACGAGLACPDWPLCHGQWIPPFDMLVLLEWGHRLLASVVGLCTVAVMVLACRRAYRRQVGGLGVLTFVLLLVQAILGGLTVLKLLHFSTVTLHLATGVLFLSLLLWMRLRVQAMAPRSTLPAITPWMGLALVLCYLQIVLGALVSSNYAGLACPDFPTCFGMWIPPLEGFIAYQFAHRVMAFLVLAVMMGATVALWRCGDRRLCSLAMVVSLGLMVQIGLGISNVLWQLPKAITIAHTGLAAALFAALTILYYQVTHARLAPTDETAH